MGQNRWRIFTLGTAALGTALLGTAALGLALCPPTIAFAQALKIGVAGPMQHPAGQQAWNGATLAAEQINAAGGIAVGKAKRTVTLVRVDTNEIASLPDAAKAVQTAIARDKVDFLVGGYRDEAVLEMQNAAMDRKKLFLGTGAALDELGLRVEKNPARYKYWFRVAPPKSSDLGQAVFAIFASAADQVRRDLSVRVPKVAILAEQSPAADPLVKAAQENLPKMRLEVVGTWRPAPGAETLGGELGAIQRSGAQLVLAFLAAPTGAALGRQMNELHVPAVAFGVLPDAQTDSFAEAGGKQGNGVGTLVPYGDVAITPATRGFVAAYRERFHATPFYSAAAYDALFLLKAAIEQVGALDPDALVGALEKSDTPATQGRLVFDKRHDPIFGPGYVTGLGVQWQNGTPVVFWPNGWHDVTYEGVKALLLPAGMKK